ncbi:hypothetical protein K3172_09115 [Qipengyuania sp. 6B39]|uniref:hypothetical protein n=1 Tax=Qipengyuania proteolytica TaxID=2867239 RepID=UPI001C897F71|nr:hypothetical protein [Qipengyuania proteolytica]MBX7496010.1 hypothetical protein [Qipengyuania proteolytica]
MRRTRLIWFALGAAAVVAVFVVSRIFTPEIEMPVIAHLELIEPVDDTGDITDEDMIANRSGALARDCGAQFFETTFLYNDHAPTLEIALTPENQKATECILSRAASQAIQTRIIYRKATNAQTH